MLKVKKIIEEIIPKTTRPTQAQIREFEESKNDGCILYEEYGSSNTLYCLKCHLPFYIDDNAEEIRCPSCQNNTLRKSEGGSNRKDSTFRTIEEIDGFIVIKDTDFRYRESVMNGIQITAEEKECIVIQGEEAGFFNYFDYVNGKENQWVRVKKPKQNYYSRTHSMKCRPFDHTVLERPVFQNVKNGIETLRLSTLYEEITEKKEAKVGTTRVNCPKFDDSLVEYPTERLSVRYEVYEKTEAMDGSGNIIRKHLWCTECGQYYTRVRSKSSYRYMSACPKCSKKNSYSSRPGLNYCITPQELEDGCLLLRVDEVYCSAYALEPHIIGENLKVQQKMQVDIIGYIYLTLDGRAHLYNSKRELTERFKIIVNKYNFQNSHFICSDDQIQVILQNKAAKRTGFIEYYHRTEQMNILYFNAMQVSPYLEMLSKVGLASMVDDIIFEERIEKIPAYLKNLETNNMLKKLTKPQIQDLIEHDCRLDKFILYIQVFKKDPSVIYDDFTWLERSSNSRHILDILRVGVPGMTVKKIREYLERVDDAQCCPPSESTQLWADYLRMLRRLDCDLTDHALIYPNSLKREHDKAARKAIQVRDEKLAQQFRERASQNEWCVWENDDFKVLVPHEVSELYEEGRKLHHCVGSYGRMVADGQCAIAFIRRKSAESIPLCTVEIREKQIVQARGISNQPAASIPKMKSFMEKWAAERGLTLSVA